MDHHASAQTGRGIAFVVDDDRQVRTLIANALVSMDFTVIELGKATEVEAALTEHRPDLIVLDLTLDKSDAVEVMRGLAAARFGGLVMIISGHDPSTIEAAQSVGKRHQLAMLDPLHKPFRLAEFKRRLAEIAPRPPEAPDDVSLEAGLRNNWLELWYQPKVSLRTRLVVGAEGLVRLRHPTRGLVAPGEFLPAVGDPLFEPLTDFIVRRALSDWSWFAQRRITMPLAMNVPASVLEHPDFANSVRRHLPDDDRFPGLIVELSEADALRDIDLAHDIAVQLKLYGIEVAIDDFGVGFSTLGRLGALPFAELKLDRKFVTGCADSESKQALCRDVIQLARRFKLRTVAEGVETLEDLRTLQELGFDQAQGFVFAGAMRRGDYAEMIVSRERRAPTPKSIAPAA